MVQLLNSIGRDGTGAKTDYSGSNVYLGLYGMDANGVIDYTRAVYDSGSGNNGVNSPGYEIVDRIIAEPFVYNLEFETMFTGSDRVIFDNVFVDDVILAYSPLGYPLVYSWRKK